MNITLRIGQRARRSISAVAGVSLVAGLGLVMVVPSASADQTPGQVCDGLDSGKQDTTGDPASVDIVAPEGFLIDRYCVKAGSALQGDGPVYVDIDPVAELTITSPSGRAVSHYSFSYTPVVVDGGSEEPSESATTDEPSESATTGEPSEEPSESETTGEPSESATTGEPSEEPSESATTDEPSESTTQPAATCPGIDDGTDYRTLFTYEYYAGDTLLGATPTWTRPLSVRMLGGPVPAPIDSLMTRAVVTLKPGVDITAGGCEYDFSLASYETQGPTFSTSGQQVFIDHDTDTITEDVLTITLEVLPAECYGQSDLYKTDEIYDGVRTPRGPSYMPITLDGNMVAASGGGTGCDEPSEEPSEIPSGSVPPSEVPSESPSELPSASVVPSESSTPVESATTTITPSVLPTTTTSTTVAAVVTQRPTQAARVLARTGVEVWILALVAGLLLVAGGAMTALSQGSSRARHH